jgi:hypothetical protein
MLVSFFPPYKKNLVNREKSRRIAGEKHSNTKFKASSTY